ncbi:L,D-transpeptidase family protein [Ignatzschineria sp. RMDPL8A]|uniref:L,D-transpeptidase family protein n=1 Tax=Ignatzschineria sp. RMDPL8A TaxID=2999236 RepID=UPI00244662D8|nr:L,D-transpeptidase family protein [Ignatzschineria sp. RMDPL8A]MDG9729320.1 L,D-transpeptidase family protein [Ignatzschineria sp. RMDPL8A]
MRQAKWWSAVGAALVLAGCNTTSGPINYAAPVKQAEVKPLLQEMQRMSRINQAWITELLAACETEKLACSMVSDKKHTLSTLGGRTYDHLRQSEMIGLDPALYYIDSVEAILADKEANIYRADSLLLMGLLAYIRDVVEGRPELKKLDDLWLLDGEKARPVATALEFIRSGGDEAVLTALEPTYPEYQFLKTGLKHYLEMSDDSRGKPITRLSEGNVLRKGQQSAAVVTLRKRLAETGYLAESQTTSSHYDDALYKVVQQFQRDHQLEPDGIVGGQTTRELNLSVDDRIEKIKVNLERWRWMPRSMGDHYIVVDIPGFEYYVVKEGEVTLRAKTVVGKDLRPTPVFSSDMNHIVFSPYWHVPRSMAVKDQLPRLKNDPNIVMNRNIRVFDSKGKEVDPRSVDWSQYNQRNFPYSLRQDPGRNNALGQVKFMFPNSHAIYLHDTPQKYLFERESRMFSSGCIRIENPTELAVYFLEEQGWDENRVQKAYERGRETTVKLPNDKKIPVFTLYMTTKAKKDGTILFRPDIYKRDGSIIAASKRLTLEAKQRIN